VILGLDIGGTKIAALVGGDGAQIVARVQRPTQAQRGPWPIIEDLKQMAVEVLEQAGLRIQDVEAIGISCGGPLDAARGIVYSPPNLPGWDRIPLKETFQKYFGLPTYVENDANAGALAEWRFGAGRGKRNVVFITASTGVGVGLILDNRLYRGSSYMAGEVWSIPLIRRGLDDPEPLRWEYLAAGPALVRRARQILSEVADKSLMWEMVGGKIEALTGEMIGEAARQGDPYARAAIEETGIYMGWGISILVNILNPDVVILGTLAIKLGDLILEPIRRTVRQEAIPLAVQVVEILPAQLGDHLGDVAALCVGMEKYEG